MSAAAAGSWPDYLAMRRALGFKTRARTAKLLGQFIELPRNSTARRCHDRARAGLGEAARQRRSPRWWAVRLSVVRGFAVYLHTLDPAHQVPPRGSDTGRGRAAPSPYLYSDAEIAALLHAAGGLPSPLRAATYQT